MTIHALKKVLKYIRQFQRPTLFSCQSSSGNFQKGNLLFCGNTYLLLVHLYLTETGEVERFISSATMVIAEEVLIVEDL